MDIDILHNADCLDILCGMDGNSVHATITDPPYFLDKLDSDWTEAEVSNKKNIKRIGYLPAGMKFDPTQGKRLYDWYSKVCKEIFRVMIPGGYFFSFSSPRLYHRMTMAVEDSGFLIKDQFLWIYTQSQVKAMGMNHVIEKLKIPDNEKSRLREKYSGWKTPQVKSCHEPITMAQKPLEGSFLENSEKYGVGLIDTNKNLGSANDMFVSNVISNSPIFDEEIARYFLVNKPNISEKRDYNTHKTVKPLEICEYLIGLTTREDQIILDPCCGSGTTCLAAFKMNRHYIGIDINKEYIDIAQRRINEYEKPSRTLPPIRKGTDGRPIRSKFSISSNLQQSKEKQ